MFELKSRYLLFEGNCSHSEYNALPNKIPIGTVHTVRGDSLFSFDYWIEKKTYLKAFRSRKKW